jgi:hypothetical protein
MSPHCWPLVSNIAQGEFRSPVGVPHELCARGSEMVKSVNVDHGLSPQATCVTPACPGGAKQGSRNAPFDSVHRQAFGLPTSKAELWVQAVADR